MISVYCSPLVAPAQTPEPAEILRIDSDLVNLNVSVFNRTSSNSATALLQKDFSILDNGVPQEITFFAASNTPFDLVLLLDLSGSIGDKLDLIRKTSKRFVDASRRDDRIAILTFAAEIRLVSKFTADHAVLKRSIDEIERPIGGTNFWDALRFVLEHVTNQSRAEQRRSAVIVMTDGVDNALPEVYGEGSRATTFEQLVEATRRTDTIVLAFTWKRKETRAPVARHPQHLQWRESNWQLWRKRAAIRCIAREK